MWSRPNGRRGVSSVHVHVRLSRPPASAAAPTPPLVLEEAVAAVEEVAVHPEVRSSQEVARVLLQERIAPQAAKDVSREPTRVALVQRA